MTTQTDTIGGNSSTDSHGTLRAWFGACTASKGGSLLTVGVNVSTAAGSIRTLIYDSDGAGGTANTLLGDSISTVATTSWNDLAITGVTIVQGHVYWIGFIFSSTSLAHNIDGSSNTTASGIITYPNVPSPANTSGGVNVEGINFRMTYTVISGSTGNNWF